jgi:fatty acid desaturase
MDTPKVTDIVSPEELRTLTRRSDAAGWWAIVSTWAIVFGTFAALARWPHPVSFVLALVVLGGRQLALAILLHEAAHRTLFKRTFLNDSVAHWLCAWPIWNSVALYKRHHLEHHKHTGSDRDPDLSLAPTSPVTRRALARKFTRDLLGISGLKRVYGQALMACEVIEYTVAPDVKRRPRAGRKTADYVLAAARNSAGFVLTNAALMAGLAAFGVLWVYWAWVVAYLTTFSLFIRVRSLAEHACTERSVDPFRNTRSTRAGWLARATVAPCNVNYHLEHHLLVAVPWFRLPRVQRLLQERGRIGAAPGYAAVLNLVSSGQAAERAA